MKTGISKTVLVILLSLILFSAAGAALADSLVLTGVPEYKWYYGCSPTSGGMLMGYWAGQGYTRLLPEVTDPMVQSTAVNAAIASSAHINAGGTYGTYTGHTADCIADFMETVNGGTYGTNIASGLAAWTSYVGLTAATTYSEVSYYGGTFSYAIFMNEIDAGHPMLLNLVTYVSSSWVGHTVLAYGYQDNMFNIEIWNGTSYDKITVAGFAVMDTWENGTGQSSWLDWSGNAITSIIDDNGVEWWPYVDLTGYSYTSLYDWQIVSGITYALVPLPPTLLLLGSGLLFLLRRRRPAGKIVLSVFRRADQDPNPLTMRDSSRPSS